MILPNKTLVNKLEVHQKKVLKQNLSLPTSTSDAAVYVISGFYHGKHRLINVSLQEDSSVDKKILWRYSNLYRETST